MEPSPESKGQIEKLSTPNRSKFETRNPVVRWLINRFYQRVDDIVSQLAPESILDAGAGEGEGILRLGHHGQVFTAAVDLGEDSLAFARDRGMQAALGAFLHVPPKWDMKGVGDSHSTVRTG